MIQLMKQIDIFIYGFNVYFVNSNIICAKILSVLISQKSCTDKGEII